MTATNDNNNTRGSTKLLIITSDDDLIRLITDTVVNHQTTQIFDTNGNNHPSDSRDIADQTNRQVTDLPKITPQPKVNTTKKRDLVCVVCGGHAIANNYNAVTCGSCKIFFHRHAFGSLELKRCLQGNGNCLVSHNIQRKCIRCRLQRCFAAGMRTDYFLTDEEKARRKKRYKNNSLMVDSHHPSPLQSTIFSSTSIEQSMSTMDNSLSTVTSDDIDRLLLDLDNGTTVDNNDQSDLQTLSIEERFCIESLRSSFLSAFHTSSILNDQSPYSKLAVHDRISIVAAWTQVESDDALKLINVFRQIGEFDALHDNDRFTLIKYNLFSLYLLQKCLIFDPVKQSFLDAPDEDLNKACRFVAVSPGSEQIKVQFMQWINSMCQVTEQDNTLVQLLLVVLLFSKGISMSENEPALLDSIAVNRAQTHYTHLIWNFLMDKWGYERAIRHFIQLLNHIFRLQAMTKLFRSFLKTQMSCADTIDRIAPLMQTILHISETN